MLLVLFCTGIPHTQTDWEISTDYNVSYRNFVESLYYEHYLSVPMQGTRFNESWLYTYDILEKNHWNRGENIEQKTILHFLHRFVSFGKSFSLFLD